MNREALLKDLTVDEALKLYVYDDKNGAPIVPGYTVLGHPTIGIGRALDVHGITAEEARYLGYNDIDAIARELTVRLPWFATLDDARQRVLANIAFNAGVGGLLKFHDTLAATQAGDYQKAGNCIVESQLAPARAKRLRDLMISAKA